MEVGHSPGVMRNAYCGKIIVKIKNI